MGAGVAFEGLLVTASFHAGGLGVKRHRFLLLPALKEHGDRAGSLRRVKCGVAGEKKGQGEDEYEWWLSLSCELECLSEAWGMLDGQFDGRELEMKYN